MASYLITGASRGIGLEIVRQLSEKPTNEVSRVFAVTRSASSAGLKSIIEKSQGRVINVVVKDFLDAEEIQGGVDAVRGFLGDAGLDVLLNNAGMSPHVPDKMQGVPGSQLTEVFNANVVTAHLITAAFLPLLRQGRLKHIFYMSSVLSSIASASQFASFPLHAYKISKAAMNMMIAQYALELDPEGFLCVGIAPGWIKTESSGEGAYLTVEEGVKGVLALMHRADKSMQGKLMNNKVEEWEHYHDGAPISW